MKQKLKISFSFLLLLALPFISKGQNMKWHLDTLEISGNVNISENLKSGSGGGGGGTLDATLNLGNTSNYANGIELGVVTDQGGGAFDQADLYLNLDSSGALFLSDPLGQYVVYSATNDGDANTTWVGANIVVISAEYGLRFGNGIGITDYNKVLYIDPNNRLIYDEDGVIVFGMTSGERIGYDFTALSSIDFGNRYLYANDGSTILIDYSNLTTLTFPTIPGYDNDADAKAHGLSSGQLYRTTTSGITALNIVPF